MKVTRERQTPEVSQLLRKVQGGRRGRERERGGGEEGAKKEMYMKIFQ